MPLPLVVALAVYSHLDYDLESGKKLIEHY
jgi:hypothetical protein